ncbi:hypothetical protein RRG08_050632 [Elysia crispata]|uniref:Uncharacterized protein n=1 Tax=Elysia crispata TaxID=231223 RepID=A0AAE0Z558_9GAST|nr:hypothetical protein RRG08_050632 [Elysia crispata]
MKLGEKRVKTLRGKEQLHLWRKTVFHWYETLLKPLNTFYKQQKAVRPVIMNVLFTHPTCLASVSQLLGTATDSHRQPLMRLLAGEAPALRPIDPPNEQKSPT